MGEAKRRGTYEQRQALAIKQRKVDDKAAAIRRVNELRPIPSRQGAYLTCLLTLALQHNRQITIDTEHY